MTKNSLIEKIKKQLKNLVNNKFAEVKAGDIVINTPDETIVVGSEVFTLDADGNNVPLVDGEYITDEGYKIVVVAGKVTEISEMESEVEAGKMKDEKMQDAPIPSAEEEKKIEEMPDTTEEMKKMGERLAKCEEMIMELMKQKETMEAKFSALASSPSTSSIELKPTEFKSIEDRKLGLLDVASIRERARKHNR
jgi:hypothetical protein